MCMLRSLSVFLVAFLVISGCGDYNKKSKRNPGGIQGSWEAKSVVTDSGQKMIIEKPTPNRPESKDEGYLQLHITETELTLITTDFVTVSDLSLPFRQEGNLIVTEDTENLSITDYEIISVSTSEMKLRPSGEGNEGTNFYYVFVRIPESQLATKMALTRSETQLMFLDMFTSDGEEFANFKVIMMGESYKEEGDYISCDYKPDSKSISFNYMKLTINDDGSASFGSDSDVVEFKIGGIILDDMSESQIVRSDAAVELLKSKVQMHGQKSSGGLCTYTIEKKGFRKLQASITCEGMTIEGDETEQPTVKASFTCVDE